MADSNYGMCDMFWHLLIFSILPQVQAGCDAVNKVENAVGILEGIR